MVVVVIERARCPFKKTVRFVLPRNVISLTVLPWNEEDELKWDQKGKKREKLISALKARAIIITKEEEEKEKMVE